MITDGKIFGIPTQVDLGNVAVAVVTLLAIVFAWNSSRSTLKSQSESIKNARKIDQIDKIFDSISEFIDKSTKVCAIVCDRYTVSASDISVNKIFDFESKDMNQVEDFSFFTTRIILKLSVLDDYSSDICRFIAGVNIAAQEGSFEKLEIEHANLRKELRNWAEKHSGLLAIKSKGT